MSSWMTPSGEYYSSACNFYSIKKNIPFRHFLTEKFKFQITKTAPFPLFFFPRRLKLAKTKSLFAENGAPLSPSPILQNNFQTNPQIRKKSHFHMPLKKGERARGRSGMFLCPNLTLALVWKTTRQHVKVHWYSTATEGTHEERERERNNIEGMA